MRKILVPFMAGLMLFALAGCGNGNNSSFQTEGSSKSSAIENDISVSTDTEEIDSSDEKILIAYFTRVGNTVFLNDIDAISSASLNIQDGELMGNTEIIASMIQKETEGELFRIETKKTYPADYDELVDYGREESDEDNRPELKSHVENMDEYDVVFLGYPNWWFDMPMAVYSFLDGYDFTGKTIIPFCTHGGSRFSDTISTLKEYLPDSDILEGFEVYGEEAVQAGGNRESGQNREGRQEHGEERYKDGKAGAGGESADAGGSPCGAGGEVPLRTHGGSEGAACKARRG